MKKILVVNDLLQGGGVEHLMHDIVHYFHKQYKFTILTEEKDSDFSKLYPENVKYYYQYIKRTNNKGKFGKIQYIFQRIRRYFFKKVIRWQHYDIVLSMKEGENLNQTLLFSSNIRKRICWVHTDYQNHYYTKLAFGSAENEVNAMKKCDYVVCVSKQIKDSIIQVIGNPGNLIIRYNPLNCQEIIYKSKENVEDITKTNSPLFISVGRIHEQKGYDRLLKACKKLNKDGFKYNLWIIGTGEEPLKKELQRLKELFHLNNVIFLGSRENPYKYMKLADWFVSSSRYEGFSYVSQEAAIIGIPMILTECSGVSELINEFHCGIVVENSIEGIYRGMKNVLEKLESQETRYINHKKADIRKFSHERFEKIEQLFTTD